jgi:hypothetical protein
VFQKLLRMVPHLPERLMEVSNEECMVIVELVRLFSPNLYTLPHPSKIQKGISSARSDDTKSLKGFSGVDKPPQHTHTATPLPECQDK